MSLQATNKAVSSGCSASARLGDNERDELLERMLLETLVQPTNIHFADRDEDGEPFDNVLRLRTAKARYMLSFRDRFKHFVAVRYEDLCLDAARTLRGILETVGVSVNQHRLHHLCEKVTRQSTYPPLPAALAEFVDSELDWQVEYEMGYGHNGTPMSFTPIARGGRQGDPYRMGGLGSSDAVAGLLALC